MEFNELDELSINIQKAENFLKNKCFFNLDEYYPEHNLSLIWDIDSKRLLAKFGDPSEKKPLIEWKIPVRIKGFHCLLPFIESCISNHTEHMRKLNLKSKISELEDYFFNK